MDNSPQRLCMVPSRTQSTKPTLHSSSYAAALKEAQLSHSPWGAGGQSRQKVLEKRVR